MNSNYSGKRNLQDYNVPEDQEMFPTTNYTGEAKFLEDCGCEVTGACVETTLSGTHGMVRRLKLKGKPIYRHGCRCPYLGNYD